MWIFCRIQANKKWEIVALDLCVDILKLHMDLLGEKTETRFICTMQYSVDGLMLNRNQFGYYSFIGFVRTGWTSENDEYHFRQI